MEEEVVRSGRIGEARKYKWEHSCTSAGIT